MADWRVERSALSKAECSVASTVERLVVAWAETKESPKAVSMVVDSAAHSALYLAAQKAVCLAAPLAMHSVQQTVGKMAGKMVQ